MPRTNRLRYLMAALVAAAALTFWLARPSRTVSAAAAQSGTRFAFSPALYRVSEGDGVATVTVSRTGDTSSAASVEYLASSGYLLAQGCGYLAWVGTATPGSDYTRTSGTLTFAAGETTKTFNVPIIDDASVESRDPETIFISLDFSHLAPPGGTDCYGSTGIIYLHDNDPTPTPTPTPAETDKRKLAFSSNLDGNYEIYVMDEDGTNLRRLTNSLYSEGSPSWSPDGRRLAFVSDRDGSSAVYVMNADGSNVNRLPLSTNNYPAAPRWSPDGARLAYVVSGPGLNNAEIYVANADGSGTPLNVTNNPGQDDFEPAWSPDGRSLAFTSRRDNGTFSVYVMNADGTGVRRVVEGYSRYPAWSPDGFRIAYVADGAQPGSDIYVVNADGTNKKLLSGERPFTFDLTPSWSTDGTRIAFVTNRDGGAVNNTEIYVMNADGSGQTRVTNSAAHDGDPAWQPRAAPQTPASPTLLTEPGTTWAVALDSVTQVADPFPVVSSSNFSADRRTRVSLFATGVSAPAASDITAEAEDSAGRRYQLPVEHAATVPGLDWLTQVTVRLPEDLNGLEYVWVGLNVRGTLTNRAVITLQK